MSERALFAEPSGQLTFASTKAARTGAVAAVEKLDGVAATAKAPARWRRTALNLPALPTRAAAFRALRAAVATEIDRGALFVLAPVFLALGALVYFSLAEEPRVIALAGGVGATAFLVQVTQSRPGFNMAAVALLLFLAGVLAASLETRRAGTAMLGGEISTLLTGRVAAVEPLASGRIRLTLDVVSTERPVLRYAPERVRVSARQADGILPGTLVSGLVRLMPPSGPVRPGSYDFSFESYFDGIGASGFFMRGPIPVDDPAAVPLAARFEAAVERSREAIAGRIRDRIGGAEGQIAAALVVGIRAGIPDDINEALRRAGIYHIISISGLHMALVAGTIMGLLRLGFALSPGFASRRPVKKYAAALALVGLAGYLFMSGGDVAAQRSFIMLAVMLTAALFDRAALTMRNLAISAMVVLLISPHEVMGPSFQMSFAATAALVGAYACWSDYRARRPTRVPPDRSFAGRAAHAGLHAMAGLAATSIVAGGATAVYSAWHFQQMPSLGLFTNLTAMPVVSILVMPFAVLATLAMPFDLDGPFLDVMGFGLTLTVAIARWFAERSPLDVVGAVSQVAVTLLTVSLLVATVSTTWLRIFALPLALAGLVALPGMRPPDLLVSEDGRLVALSLGDGRVAVNRSRPNAFTLENWQRALLADTVIKPGAAASSGSPSEAAAGFFCVAGLCLARHASGAIVAHAEDGDAAADACTKAQVIVIEDASARTACVGHDVVIVSGRDLARRGSAAISLGSVTGSPTGKLGTSGATVIHAVATPYRPWHDNRRFSRAARGFPPFRRTDSRPAE